MAGDENRVDLNLYVGLPPLPRPRYRHLGSDLTLSPLPPSPLSPGESRSPAAAAAGSASERPTSQRSYSPSNALHAPESLPVDPLHAADDGPFLEHCVPARLAELETHASAAADSAPAPAGPDQPPASHPPAGRISWRHDEAAASSCPCSAILMVELASRGDRPRSRQELLECPELRFQRLIESNNRLRPQRPRMPDGERSDPQTNPEQLMHDIMHSQRSLEASKKDKLNAGGKGTEGSEKEKEDESAANFECNICFDLADEPVVTPCGHLFCWPCLYQWLRASPVFPECPVCKGEVREAGLTPIYGRGGSDTAAKKVSGENGNSGPKIPPRPHAHRTESMRQELRRSAGPLFRQEGRTAWRHIRGEDAAHSAADDQSPLGLTFTDSDRDFVVNRMLQLRMQLDESRSNIIGIELPVNTEASPHIDSANSLTRGGIGPSQRPPPGRASASRLRARPQGRSAGRRAPPSLNPHSPEPLHRRPTVQSAPATEQASASSAAAVTPGDIAAADISAEPNRAGSSRSLRRRGRSSNSGLPDVDGGASNTHRRRRLN